MKILVYGSLKSKLQVEQPQQLEQLKLKIKFHILHSVLYSGNISVTPGLQDCLDINCVHLSCLTKHNTIKTILLTQTLM